MSALLEAHHPAPVAVCGRILTFDESLRVLYVEDNEEQANFTMRMLKAGYTALEISWKRTLLGAMLSLAGQPADVILLDLGMPELDGIKTLTAIRVKAPRTPIVILTGNASPEARSSAAEAGVRHYLIKQETTPADIRAALYDAAFQRR